jgi:hypothetical protein
MLLSALALVLVQSPSPNGGSPSGVGPAASDTPTPAELHVFDEVVQIVNENMLTSVTFIRAMRFESHGRGFANEREQMDAQKKIQVETVKTALRIQAGQDMGLDPAQVDREARNWIESRRELLGQDAFAEMLRKSSMTLYEYQEFIRDRLYSEFWENHVTGSGPVGQGERQSRDRFVRPGYMLFRYREAIKHPVTLEKIGGRDQSVIVQQLILDPRDFGGLEAARTQAGDLRRRILAGEDDMSDLVDRYGALKTNHGIENPHPEELIAKADPGLAGFIAEAKPGDVSEVLELTTKGRTGIRLARLVDRLPALVPEMSSIDTQKKLEKGLKSELSEWRKDQAYGVLYKSSYVWPTGEERSR